MKDIFAKLYDPLMAPMDWAGLREMRERVVGPATGRVLEIGVGTGLNFPFYRHAALIVGFDPDLAMLVRARRRAAQSSVPILLLQASAEELPFANETFDSVVSTLTFCTVGDPVLALREAIRVLKPAGEIRLLEHVRLPQPLLGRVQDIITPAWASVCGGCHPNRDTLSYVSAAGFSVLDVRSYVDGLLLEIVAAKR